MLVYLKRYKYKHTAPLLNYIAMYDEGLEDLVNYAREIKVIWRVKTKRINKISLGQSCV